MFSMTGETCATLAQIVPVLLLALVVEWRGELSTAPGGGHYRNRLIYLFSLVTFLADEALMVAGVQIGGLNGQLAWVAWSAFSLLLLSTITQLGLPLLESKRTESDRPPPEA
jgi:hypothetical protein